MLEEAASNAVKYGVAGSARCTVSFGLNPHGQAGNSARSRTSNTSSPLASPINSSLGWERHPNQNYLYVVLSSQNPSSLPQLEPSQLAAAFGHSRGLDRIFADRASEMPTAPAVVRRRPSCASPSPASTPSIGRFYPSAPNITRPISHPSSHGEVQPLPHGDFAPGTVGFGSSLTGSVAASPFVPRVQMRMRAHDPSGAHNGTVALNRSPDSGIPSFSRISPRLRTSAHTDARGSSHLDQLGGGGFGSSATSFAAPVGEAGDRRSSSAANQAVGAPTAAAPPAGAALPPGRGGGLGLSTVTRAAAAVAGDAWLTSTTDGPQGIVTTTFHALVPAWLPPNTDVSAPGPHGRAMEQTAGPRVGMRPTSERRALWSRSKPPETTSKSLPTTQPTLRAQLSCHPTASAQPSHDPAPTASRTTRDPSYSARRPSAVELSTAESIGRAALERLVHAATPSDAAATARQVNIRRRDSSQVADGPLASAERSPSPTQLSATTAFAADGPHRAVMAAFTLGASSPLASNVTSSRYSTSPHVSRCHGRPHSGLGARRTTSPSRSGMLTSAERHANSSQGDLSVQSSEPSSLQSGEWDVAVRSSAPLEEANCPNRLSRANSSRTSCFEAASDNSSMPSSIAPQRTVPAASSSLPDSVDSPSQEAAGEESAPPPGDDWGMEELVIYGVDDSAMMRRMLDTLSRSVLGCSADHCAMLGASMAEVDAFIDVAMGRAPARPGMTPRAAHLIIVDQHLTFDVGADDEIEMLGTNLVQELHELGFGGVVCMHSGALDYARLVQLPGVDMVVQKGSLSLDEFGQELRNALATKQPHVQLN
mmetsp:Transcript_16367/g.45702  ORF Transcript_16367/g.45702 Transcript_16367/m.45702 type:complete len:822 (-) Transcript_16367:231-2696(-)